jgi:hypothetical protein
MILPFEGWWQSALAPAEGAVALKIHTDQSRGLLRALGTLALCRRSRERIWI